jgi:hypothetical protein
MPTEEIILNFFLSVLFNDAANSKDYITLVVDE